MIRVGYDVTALAQSPYGGIARVCYHTLKQARRHADIEAHGYYRSGRATDELTRELTLLKAPLAGRWGKESFDIVHGLCHRRPRLKGRRSVYTLHDVWSLYPNRYQSTAFQKKIGARMRRELVAVDMIVTDSETTRTNLIRLDLVPPEKVVVAQLGVEVEVALDNEVTLLPVKVADDYVLFVGCLEVRKNLGHVIEAVAPLSGVDLVLVGTPGFGYEDEVKPHLGKMLGDRLHLFSRLDPRSLAALYRDAVATLLPSWEEGFGLPILEAMAYGSPVITSNCSASAEVGGEAAVLVPPDHPSASTTAIQRLLDDSQYRSELVAAGRARASEFTWQRYFERLVTLYRQLL